MVNEFIYTYEDDNGNERELEVHYEFIPGCRGIYNRAPEDCHPAEGPEVHILYVVNPKNGNEYLEEEWPVDEETLIDAIIASIEEEHYEN